MDQQAARIVIQLGIGVIFSLTDFIVRIAEETDQVDPTVEELRERQKRHRELRNLPGE